MVIAVALLTALFISGGSHEEARRCSLAPGYLMPSNYELVRDTPVIALGTVRRITSGRERSVVIDITEVLKGGIPTKTIEVEGGGPYLGPSKLNDFSSARPGAYTGGCLAYDYKRGTSFLLFLRKYEG